MAEPFKAKHGIKVVSGTIEMPSGYVPTQDTEVVSKAFMNAQGYTGNPIFIAGETISSGDRLRQTSDGKIYEIQDGFTGTATETTLLSGVRNDGGRIISSVNLADDLSVLMYRNSSDYVSAIAYRINKNGTYSFGSALQITDAVPNSPSYDHLTKIGTNRFLISYMANSTTLKARACSVNTTTLAITRGNETTIQTDGVAYINSRSFCYLSEGKFSYSYLNPSNASYWYSAIHTVSGETITINSGVMMGTAYSGGEIFSAVVVSSNKYVVNWGSSSSGMNVSFVSYSGTTPSHLASKTASSTYNNISGRVALARVNDNTVAITFYLSNPYLGIEVFQIDGSNNITSALTDTGLIISSLNSSSLKITQFGETQKWCLSYADTNITYYATVTVTVTSLVATCSSATALTSGNFYSSNILMDVVFRKAMYVIYNKSNNTGIYVVRVGYGVLGTFFGIAQGSGNQNDSVAVATYGNISKVHSGLTTQAKYYLQSNGTISTTVSDICVGLAYSSTWLSLSSVLMIPLTYSTVQIVNRTSTFSANSSAFTDITGMSFSLTENSTYLIEMLIKSHCSESLYFDFTKPTGTTWHLEGSRIYNATTFYPASFTSSGEINVGTSGNVVRLSGYLKTTNAGTLQLKFRNESGSYLQSYQAPSFISIVRV